MIFLYSNRKKKEFFTFLLSLISVFAFGQIVNIPDANFKAKLLDEYVAKDLQGDWIFNIDSNENNELEIGEVQNVSVLDVSGVYIESMEGINRDIQK